MEAISKWEVTVDKSKFIVNEKEVEFILANQNQRFIKLKDLVINPAFIQSIVLVEKNDGNQLPEHARTSFVDGMGRPIKD